MNIVDNTELDVVIGSYGVECHLERRFNSIKPMKDVDILTKEKKENIIVSLDIRLKTTKKVEAYEYITDYELVEPATSNQMIYDWCNNNKQRCIKKSIGLIPPIELLYVIYLSHIHRIIPYFDSQTNINIWTKSFEKYICMRQNIGYKIDDILYNECNKDNYLHKIFHKRFEETNQKYGDTKIDMTKSENEFFKDNVCRYFEHDFIHAEVGLMLRGEHSFLFMKFQKEGSVALDEDKFVMAKDELKINMFREEVTVLFLERFVIPTLYENYDIPKKKFSGFDNKLCADKIIELCLHLILNLSGSGHHFLRRYGINHFNQISDRSFYNFGRIINLALSLTKIDLHIDDIIVKATTDNNVELFLDRIIKKNIEKKTYINLKKTKNSCDVSKLIGELSNDIFKNDEIFTKTVNYIKMYDSLLYVENNLYYAPKVNIGIYSDNFSNAVVDDLCEQNKEDEMNGDKMNEDKMNEDRMNEIDFRLHNIFKRDKIKDNYVLVTIKKMESYTTQKEVKNISRENINTDIYSLLANTKIEIEYMSVNEINNKFSLKAVQNGIMTYYKSNGCSFGEQDIIDGEIGYINNYGDVPQCFHRLLENTFKYELNTAIFSARPNYTEDDEY